MTRKPKIGIDMENLSRETKISVGATDEKIGRSFTLELIVHEGRHISPEGYAWEMGVKEDADENAPKGTIAHLVRNSGRFGECAKLMGEQVHSFSVVYGTDTNAVSHTVEAMAHFAEKIFWDTRAGRIPMMEVMGLHIWDVVVEIKLDYFDMPY